MKKYIVKYIIVIGMIGATLYTFQEMIDPVMKQIMQTTWQILVGICLCCFMYELIEGWVTYSLVHTYDKNFKYRYGVESAFYACFYRVITLGSGAGISVVYFLNGKGLSYSSATGLYMMEYVIHRISIVMLSAILLLLHYTFIHAYVSAHLFLLFCGYAVTVTISILLAVLCISKKVHTWILIFFRYLNRKSKNKWTNRMDDIMRYFIMLEDAASTILKDKKLILCTILKNFVKLLFWYGIPFVILYSYHRMSFGESITLCALSVVLSAVIPAPAGLGALEFVMILLFAQKTGHELAACISILYRFATFVFPFLVGGSLLFVKRMYIHHIHNKN